MSIRHFEIDKVLNSGAIVNVPQGGRYVASKPCNAASKAFTQACRLLNKTGPASLEVHIRETTRGSEKKVFKYIVNKIQNDSKVSVNGKDILFTYNTRIKSIK